MTVAAFAKCGMNGFAHDRTNIGKDRKSTRLNSSHLGISYAVFCLNKKRPALPRPSILCCAICPKTEVNEGPGTWSPYVVIGHLIHGEKADWMPRLNIILEHGPGRPFDKFEREAQFRDSKGKTLTTLLDEFTGLRQQNLVFFRDSTPPDIYTLSLHDALPI